MQDRQGNTSEATAAACHTRTGDDVNVAAGVEELPSSGGRMGTSGTSTTVRSRRLVHPTMIIPPRPPPHPRGVPLAPPSLLLVRLLLASFLLRPSGANNALLATRASGGFATRTHVYASRRQRLRGSGRYAASATGRRGSRRVKGPSALTVRFRATGKDRSRRELRVGDKADNRVVLDDQRPGRGGVGRIVGSVMGGTRQNRGYDDADREGDDAFWARELRLSLPITASMPITPTEEEEEPGVEHDDDEDTSSAPALTSRMPIMGVGDSWTYDLPNAQTSYNTTMVVIDMEDTIAERIAELRSEGRTVVCYISAGSYEPWRSDVGSFSTDVVGEKMGGWEEWWIDTRSPLTRDIMETRIRRAAEKGCQGLEPDNVDGWENDTGFNLTRQDSEDYLLFLSTAANANGLLIALKNSATIASSMEPHFDFAVVEECNEWNECHRYESFVDNGKPVFAVEYVKYDAGQCYQFDERGFSLIFSNYDLTTFRFCPPPKTAPEPLMAVGDSWTYDLPNMQTSYNTSTVVIDMEDTSAERITELIGEGRTVVCYISAGSQEPWRSDAGNLSVDVIGEKMGGWDEWWIDTRSPLVRDIMETRIERAAEKGCQGLEPDNVDGWENDTGFNLTRQDSEDYLLFLSAGAKANGLLIALKNSASIASSMEPHFDFAIVEECEEWNECQRYESFVDSGKPVYAVEYVEYDEGQCSQFDERGFSLIFSNYDLTTFRFCPPKAAPEPLMAVGDSWTYDLPNMQTSYNTTTVVINMEDTSAERIAELIGEGRIVVCYISAGSQEPWRSDAGNFSADVIGEKMGGWDEWWIDTRSPLVRDIMETRIERAAEKGCQGLEPDNVDGWENDTGFNLTRQDSEDYLLFLSAGAKANGLLIALKNSASIASSIEPHFDFAIVEECEEWNECHRYESFVDSGKPVYAVEYVEYDEGQCSQFDERGFSLIFSNYDLTTFRFCPPKAAPEPLMAVGDSWTYDLPNMQTSYNTTTVVIDMEDTSAERIAELIGEGRTVVCYISAGSQEPWRSDAGNFSADVIGEKMGGWDEWWIDTRSPLVRDIMETRIERAAEKGCQGLEPDNVDGWENDTGFNLTRQDSEDYLLFLSAGAKANGLLIALKNSASIASSMEPHFDFAIVEECEEWNECHRYESFVDSGKPVYAVEYVEYDEGQCSQFDERGFSLIFSNYDLTAFRFCPPKAAPEPLMAVGDSWTYDLPNMQTSYNTTTVVIDMEDTSAARIAELIGEGRTVVCYISAGSHEPWRSDAGNFSADVIGEKMGGWDEWWIDTRSPLVRDIMETRIERAAEKGCQGLEPDNVDGWENDTGFNLTRDNAEDYLLFLSNVTRTNGLLIALKNSASIASGMEPHFDFAIVEECHEWSECDRYRSFVDEGKPVFAVEYAYGAPGPNNATTQLCVEFANHGFSLIFSNYDLTTFETCPSSVEEEGLPAIPSREDPSTPLMDSYTKQMDFFMLDDP